MLPDDALLEIFDHYMADVRLEEDGWKTIEKAWQSLVHVCHRWRSTVFGSPRRLDLQLVCSRGTPARDTLDVWPALPLVIRCDPGDTHPIRGDNIIAVLEHTDRVCHIFIPKVLSSDLEILLSAMQKPFPELTYLQLWLPDEAEVPVLPDSFLGGSAPRLKRLAFGGIPFPGLPKLLMSATQLVALELADIPHSGYFPPDAIVTALSTLTSIDYLVLEFRSPRSCPDPANRLPPPLTRSALPVLSSFLFNGVTEYLEDLVTCIDVPQLKHLDVTFFYDITIDIPQLIQFISHTPMSELKKVHITLRDRGARVDFSPQTFHDQGFMVEISCKRLDWQLSSLEQVCTSCLPFLSVLEDLYFYEDPHSEPDRNGNIDNGLWIELLHPFASVKNLYVSEKFASDIMPALQELVEGGTTEVQQMLPTLQNIFLAKLESSGAIHKGLEQFVAAREVSGLPIAVSLWTSYEQDSEDRFF